MINKFVSRRLEIKERTKHRKNFLPALILDLLLVVVWGIVFFFVPPETPFIPLVFLILTGLLILFTGALLLGNSRRGVLASVGVVVFLVLGYFGAGNWINLVLIIGLLLTLEYYLSRG